MKSIWFPKAENAFCKILSELIFCCSQLGSHISRALNARAERRAIWACINVATGRRERSNRAIQHIWKFFRVNHVLYILTVTALKASILNYWSTRIVGGMGFPPFVADHRCVSFPPNMMTYVAHD